MSLNPARLALALALSVSAASAATLHRPLPAGSLERNGTPQPMQRHAHPHVLPPALPPTAPFKYAAQGLKRHYGGTPVDVLTYHYDLNRTGWNAAETDLTPATVGSGNFGQLTQLSVDGNVLAQPLLVSNFTMPNGSVHDVLIIATGHDSVYAFDADTYARLWHARLGQSQSSNDVGCGDVVPEYGISSTPVILRSGPDAASIYVVAATEPAQYSFHTKLHELDLATGKDMISPVEIAPQAKLKNGGTINFDPQNQWNRAALAYNNGNLYVGIGSHCDNNAGGISGWLLDYDTTTLKLLHHFHTIETAENYELASIWMTGFAPAIDDSGNVFVVTGNGAFGKGGRDWGESVLHLPPDLKRADDYFTPASYQQLNNGDVDFGSGGVMLLPTVQGQTAPPMAVAIGKDAVLYLLNQNKLGKEKAGDAGALQSQTLGSPGGGTWGGPAYYDGPNGGMVYVQINNDVLRGYSVATGSKPALKQVAAGTSQAGYGGSLPIVSSNGGVSGTGVVWLIRRGATIQLEAYDALALGKPLFAANAGQWSNGAGNSFLTPMEANGRVYVPAYKTVTVFGLGQ
ncbi:MAG: pyrrolo-quinoline quinone [Rhizomicrobium sp.]